MPVSPIFGPRATATVSTGWSRTPVLSPVATTPVLYGRSAMLANLSKNSPRPAHGIRSRSRETPWIPRRSKRSFGLRPRKGPAQPKRPAITENRPDSDLPRRTQTTTPEITLMEQYCLLAATENGNWRLGIGDPTPVGWITAIAYLAAALACGLVWAADRRARRQGWPGSPVFWITLALLLVLLGINKQLDLQTLLGDIGRRKARAEGWYGNRRFYQAIFIAAVAVAGLFAIGVFSWLARGQWKRNLLGLLGTVFLYVFVLIRASSIHHVDVALQWRFAGAKWNWMIELGGIAVVLLGAAIAWSWSGRLESSSGAGDSHSRFL